MNLLHPHVHFFSCMHFSMKFCLVYAFLQVTRTPLPGECTVVYYFQQYVHSCAPSSQIYASCVYSGELHCKIWVNFEGELCLPRFFACKVWTWQVCIKTWSKWSSPPGLVWSHYHFTVERDRICLFTLTSTTNEDTGCCVLQVPLSLWLRMDLCSGNPQMAWPSYRTWTTVVVPWFAASLDTITSIPSSTWGIQTAQTCSRTASLSLIPFTRGLLSILITWCC